MKLSKIISFLNNEHRPIKKSNEKNVLGHKMYKLFQAPLSSEANKHLKVFCFSSISHQPKFIKCDSIHI